MANKIVIRKAGDKSRYSVHTEDYNIFLICTRITRNKDGDYFMFYENHPIGMLDCTTEFIFKGVASEDDIIQEAI